MNTVWGENYIGSFNNENRNDVAQIKECAATLVNLIFQYGADPERNEDAARQIEIGTMLGIKSVFS